MTTQGGTGQGMTIKGKRALITGGSSGIGFAIAQALLAKGAAGIAISGRRVAVVNEAVQQLSKAGGGKVFGIAADVGTAEGRAATLDQALAVLGGLDILINNAGGVRAGRLEQMPEADILKMIEVDLAAPILLTRAALPALRASGDAVVINVSSGLGLVGAPFYAAYGAVKAGLGHFGESLRRELKGEGIHVITVYPGGTGRTLPRPQARLRGSGEGSLGAIAPIPPPAAGLALRHQHRSRHARHHAGSPHH
jgi:uncharacterized oxidoreductase